VDAAYLSRASVRSVPWVHLLGPDDDPRNPPTRFAVYSALARVDLMRMHEETLRR